MFFLKLDKLLIRFIASSPIYVFITFSISMNICLFYAKNVVLYREEPRLFIENIFFLFGFIFLFVHIFLKLLIYVSKSD